MNAGIFLNDRYNVKEKSKTNQVTFKVNESSRLLYRIFDFLFSLVAILIFMPIMFIIAILIKVNSPKSTVFFKQKRLGLDGKLFDVYKFRTMVVNAESKLEEMLEKNEDLREEYRIFKKLKNDPRIISNIGNFLRKSSLDEVPQFFNVLFGQMSIVGPRPYIKNEFDIYPTNLELNIVTSVKPGITGYWQVIPERHDTTFEKRVQTDIEYIENKSFLLDLEIIAKTLGVMVLRKGA